MTPTADEQRAEVERKRAVERQVEQFEGLVFETARQIVAGGVEIEFDDVRQVLRMKVWHAIQRYESSHAKGLPLRRFVFGCLWNLRRDIEKRPLRYNASIEEMRARGFEWEEQGKYGGSDRFDLRYLSVTEEEAFAEIEDEPACLSELTELEREVVRLRCEGLLLGEIETALGLAPDQAKTAMQSVREKLADLRPSAAAPRNGGMRALPDAAARTAQPPLSHAA